MEGSLKTIREVARGGAAVVFVHGFGGDASATWGGFPGYLKAHKGLQDWGVYTLGYATRLRLDILGLWVADPDLPKVALALSTALGNGPLGKARSLCIVAHSMGGLATQRALLDDAPLRSRVSHVFLFGTPSAGLAKASWARLLKPQIRDMGRDSDFIRRLRTDWDARFGPAGGTRLRMPFEFFTVGGERDEFAPFDSSHGPFPEPAYAGRRFVIPGNHIEIVKPDNAKAPAVQLVLKPLMGDAASAGPWNAARLAVQSRDFQSAIELLQPKQDKLDTDGVVQLALALEGAGRQDDALALLRSRTVADTDVMGVLAGRLKRRWLVEHEKADARSALDLYRQGLASATRDAHAAQAYYHGINLAFMLLMHEKKPAAAKQEAKAALEWCRRAQQADELNIDRKWRLATEGEAQLLLGQPKQALESYRLALAESPQPWEIQSMYQQALCISRMIGDDALRRALTTLFRPGDEEHRT